jgi:hypothetical protein
MEDMDRIFGGNQGQEDMERIANIRARLGITEAPVLDKAGVNAVENVSGDLSDHNDV